MPHQTVEKKLYHPTPHDIEKVHQLASANLVIQAWDIVQHWVPFDQWQGAKASRLAASLASKLGNNRLSSYLDIINFKKHPDDPDCFIFGMYARLNNLGSFITLPEIDAKLATPDLTDDYRAQTLAIKASMLNGWNDFDTALSVIDEADRLIPNDSWTHVIKSRIRVSADQYELAEIEARKSHSLRPTYTPAVIQLAECLTHLGRDDDAIEVLTKAHKACENAAFAGRLQAFYSERDNHVEALKWLNLYEQRSPLMDKTGKKWITNRRCDFLYMAEKFDQYIELSKTASKYHENAGGNLSKPGATEAVRKKLDVPFVRQHDMTCAPATLAAIARFFGKELDHLEIADAICYNGTPWHMERLWAEKEGFIAREFRLTREVVIELIDRNIPFTLTTSWATGAHLQACIGYDDRLGTVLIRDPTNRHYGEMTLKGLIENHPFDGPRGMLIIPVEQKADLDGITFVDESIYNARHDLMLAIDKHDNIGIMAAQASLALCEQDNPLLLSINQRLASYEKDLIKEKEITGEMLDRFPENQSAKLRHLYSIQKTSNKKESQDYLKAIVEKGNCDSIFYIELGESLAQKIDQIDLAYYYLKKAIRYNPSNSQSYAVLSSMEHRQNNLTEALHARYIAACLNNTFEPYSKIYFDLCVEAGDKEKGLSFLKKRVSQLGGKNSGPWITLIDALDELNNDLEVSETLIQAKAARPNDGELMMTVAEKLAGWGRTDEAEKLLYESKELVTEAQWSRQMAVTADIAGNRKKALRYWKRVTELNQVSPSAQRAYSRLLADEEGEHAVIKYLKDLTDKHPENEDLLVLYAGWLSESDLKSATTILEKAVIISPNDIWNLRELAIYHSKTGNIDKAIELGQSALQKNPMSEESHGVLGGFYMKNHLYEKASEHFAQAISINADYTYGIEQWVECGIKLGNVDQVLEKILTELRSQVSQGSSLMTYRSCAYKYIDQDVLLEELKNVCKARPDLWQSWTVLKDQQISMGMYDDALITAKDTTDRFPLIPRIWSELANVYRYREEPEEEINCLEKALSISPSWDFLIRQLSEVYERLGRYDKAGNVLHKAIEWNPRQPINHGMLADILWKQDNKNEAFESLLTALKHDHEYNWGWNQIADWSSQIKREDEVIQLLAHHHERLQCNSGWWATVAGVHSDFENYALALESIESGLSCDPKNTELHSSKAYYLAQSGDIEAALEATEPNIYEGSIPRDLLARRAWLLKEYGHSKEAKILLKKLTKEHPDYIWPYQQLLNYQNDEANWQEVISTAKALIRLEPSHVVAHGWLGNAYEKLNKPQEAIIAYQKAILISPDYHYAAYRIGTVSIQSEDVTTLRELLPQLEHNHPESLMQYLRIGIHCVEGNKQNALDELNKAYRSKEIDEEDIQNIYQSFTHKKWTKDYKKIVHQIVTSGEAQSEPIIHAWFNGKKLPGKLAKQLHKMPYEPSLKEQSWAYIINQYVDLGIEADALLFYRKYKEITSSDFLWGKIAWMLSCFQKHKQVIKFMSDYKDRKGIESAMMYNLLIAKSSLNQLDDIREISQHGIHSLQPGEFTHVMAMIEALLAACNGETELAKNLIQKYEVEVCEWSESLFILAKMVLSAHDTQQVKELWKQFIASSPEWQSERYLYNYVIKVKSTFKDIDGAQWPAAKRFRKKFSTNNERNSKLIWILVIGIYILIRILGKITL